MLFELIKLLKDASKWKISSDKVEYLNSNLTIEIPKYRYRLAFKKDKTTIHRFGIIQSFILRRYMKRLEKKTVINNLLETKVTQENKLEPKKISFIEGVW